MRRKSQNIQMWVFLIIAVVMVVVSLFPEWFAPNDPYTTNVMRIKEAPSSEFPFGTDALGRCVFSRVIYGAQTSIFAALALVFITAVLGTVVGVLCGYYSGIADRVVMRGIDGLMAFPQMVLAIAVVGIMGGGMANAMLALGFSSWMPYARLARSRVISVKKEEFVQAARLSGCSDFAIMWRYIFPSVFSSLLAYAATQIGIIMLGFAGLSFLNLGVQSPQAEWGSMISEARGMIVTAYWTVLYPALALVLTVMLFNYLGDALRDKLDVREIEGFKP